jgi:hypothetical protein
VLSESEVPVFLAKVLNFMVSMCTLLGADDKDCRELSLLYDKVSCSTRMKANHVNFYMATELIHEISHFPTD